ncbi:hypothetical protein [uncultured Deefgea sp.]|uniref:hypothetical protein n=1 Tax=uncultured Deefgea sp. TaxID=1304914 RepID=UPI002598EC34|nr:hypothetical protein [uncultured Deefgea sp.]
MSETEKKKYRYTKSLINIAIKDGWTQAQIAVACRTQQSVVSDWKKGVKQAFEHQIRPLLDIYGNKLRRTAFKIYPFIEASGEVKMAKVEGEVILQYAFRKKEINKRLTPTRKIAIHSMGKGEFCIVLQHFLYKDQFLDQYDGILQWNAIVVRVETSALLIEETTKLSEITIGNEVLLDKHELLSLDIALKKALLQNGFPVDGVEEYLAAC